MRKTLTHLLDSFDALEFVRISLAKMIQILLTMTTIATMVSVVAAQRRRQHHRRRGDSERIGAHRVPSRQGLATEDGFTLKRRCRTSKPDFLSKDGDPVDEDDDTDIWTTENLSTGPFQAHFTRALSSLENALRRAKTCKTEATSVASGEGDIGGFQEQLAVAKNWSCARVCSVIRRTSPF